MKKVLLYLSSTIARGIMESGKYKSTERERERKVK